MWWWGQEEARGVHGPEQEHAVGLEDSLGEYFDGKLNSLAGQAVGDILARYDHH